MEIRKSLEANFLTCRQCQQPYRKPKVLTCLHTFCHSCLDELLAENNAKKEAKEMETAKLLYSTQSSLSDYKSGGGYRRKWSSRLHNSGYDSSNYSNYRYKYAIKDETIVCPVCNKQTTLPSGGVSELPTDLLADKLASMVDRMPNFPVCDVCTKHLLMTDTVDSCSMIEQSTPNRQTQFMVRERYAKGETQSSGEDERLFFDSDHNDDLSFAESARTHETRSRRPRNLSSESKPRKSRRQEGSSLNGDSRSDPRPANTACLECGKRLCSRCSRAHNQMPVTSNHVQIRVEKMSELNCARHPKELRRFFCLTCRAYICIVCTFESTSTKALDTISNGSDASEGIGHADHEIMSIRQAVTAYQDQLSRDSATTQDRINRIEALLMSLQICENEMQRLYTEIDASAKNYIDQIKKQQNMLQEKINQLTGVPLKILTNECTRLMEAMQNWYDFLNDERITSRLDLMDPLDALAEGGPMLDRVAYCLETTAEPLSGELAKQPFLTNLKAAETLAINGDSGLTSSQSLSPSSQENEPSQPIEDHRVQYWRSRLGLFQPGKLEFGRIVTTKELAAEAKVEASKRMNTYVQTGPELVKALPPPKGSQRHRAIQVELSGSSLEDRGIQTDPINLGHLKVPKADSGTQYQSSDINPPVSMYRSIRQILVQK